jgi:hypothetical protein
VRRAVIEALAAQGDAGFAEVDTHLMSAASFQLAFDQAKIAESLDDANMSDGKLPVLAAAAPAVTAIGDEMRLNACVLGLPTDQSKIASANRVRAKLLAQLALGFRSASEDDEPACFLVDAMHRPNSALNSLARFGQDARQEIDQSGRQKFLGPPSRSGDFMRVPHRRQPRRFLDNDEMRVGIAQDNWIYFQTHDGSGRDTLRVLRGPSWMYFFIIIQRCRPAPAPLACTS